MGRTHHGAALGQRAWLVTRERDQMRCVERAEVASGGIYRIENAELGC